MVDEIQIGVDASQGISELGNFRKALESTLQAGGASASHLTKQMNTAERSISSLSKQMADAQRVADRAERKQREMAQFGVKQNSKGQFITDSGRFASAEQTAGLRERLAYIDRVGEREAALERMRGINAQNEYSRAQKANTIYGRTADEWAERAKKQTMYDQLFGGPAQAEKTTSSLAKLGARLREIPPASTIQKMSAFSARVQELGAGTRYAMYDVAHSATAAGLAIAGFGVASIAAAVSHERAFANVARTTQTTEQGYAIIQRQLEEMAMELPVSFKELTNIATAAGQLGISAGGIKNFTETVAMLSATTNLSSDAAATALARFKAFFAEAKDPSMAVTEATFSNLASSILKVGINSIATETGIVNVSTQIASMGKYAGFVAHEVIGLAGALSSVGVAPELARGLTTRMFTIMGNAVSDGGVRLEKFAKLSGMTADEFKDAWGGGGMAGVFTKMLQGLHGMTENGQDANKALSDLGITAVRDRPVWLRLADAAGESGKAGTLLAQTMADARDGWIRDIELQAQYAKISETTAARLQVLGQAFEQLFATIGGSSGTALGDLAEWLTMVVKGFEAMAQSDVGKTFSNVGVTASLAVGGMLLAIGGLARITASIQGVGQALDMVRTIAPRTGAVLSATFKAVTVATGIVGVIALLGTLATSFIVAGAESEKAKRALQDYDGLLAAMKIDGESGKSVGSSLEYAASSAGEMTDSARGAKQATSQMMEALYGASSGGDAAARGLNSAAAAADNVRYAVGSAAKEFLRTELTKSTEFQKIFEDFSPDKLNSKGLDFSLLDFDWDAISAEQVRKGGDAAKLIQKEIERLAGKDVWDPTSGADGYVDGARVAEAEKLLHRLSAVFGNSSGDVQAYIDKMQALSTATSHTAAEVIDDVSLIDEATQKMVDRMAQGFGKFVDPKGLIGLTQEMTRAGEEGEDVAAKFEESWTKAYGGASFKLSDYMTVFSRAAGEQKTFVSGLQTLLANGLDSSIVEDLAAMGPEAARLVQALVNDVNENAGAGLAEFEEMWGQTGYDSMMKMAASMKIGEVIVGNIFSALGVEGLQRFNDALASGMGTNEALASMQLTFEGKPLVPVMGEPTGATTQAMIAQGMMQVYVDGKPVLVPIKGGKADTGSVVSGINTLQGTANSRPVTVKVYATNGGNLGGILSILQNEAYSSAIMVPVRTYNAGGTGIPGKTMLAGGGYTGPGGKWKEAGVVHAGEFVMTAKATRAIGVDNLYRLMREANSTTYRPSGYANGGAVGGGGSGGMGVGGVVSLSAHDRELLRRLGDISLYIGNEQVMRANHSAGSTNARRGRG